MAVRADVITQKEAEGHPSLADLVRDILQDVGRIVRAEVQLARTELREKAQRAGKAAGMLGGAAVGGLLAAVCFLTTCVAALALVMPVWLASLLMGILLSFMAAGAYVIGRTKLGQIDPVPQKTVQTMKDDIRWAKQRTE